jgi:hypothetical protein
MERAVIESRACSKSFEIVPGLPRDIAEHVGRGQDVVNGVSTFSPAAQLTFDKTQYDAPNDSDSGLRDGTNNSTEQRLKTITGDALHDIYGRLADAEKEMRGMGKSMDGLVVHHVFIAKTAKEQAATSVHFAESMAEQQNKLAEVNHAVLSIETRVDDVRIELQTDMDGLKNGVDTAAAAAGQYKLENMLLVLMNQNSAPAPVPVPAPAQL